MQTYDKKIESAFNMLSRSRMMIHLATMRSLNLVEDTELETFTQETKDELKL